MKSSDPVIEHMAVTLLPHCIALVRNLKASNFRIKDVRGSDTLNIVNIIADVAECLAAERFGKPRYRVPAGRRERI